MKLLGVLRKDYEDEDWKLVFYYFFLFDALGLMKECD